MQTEKDLQNWDTHTGTDKRKTASIGDIPNTLTNFYPTFYPTDLG